MDALIGILNNADLNTYCFLFTAKMYEMDEQKEEKAKKHDVKKRSIVT